MALVPCPACGREVSDAAPSCPGCGHPIALGPALAMGAGRPARRRHPGCALLGAAALLLIGAAVLLAIALGTFQGGAGERRMQELRRIEQAGVELELLRGFAESFRAQEGRLPASLEELARSEHAGGRPAWGLLLDPWERSYRYALDPLDPAGYRLWSLGPDPEDPADDLVK
jgi:hypothetical protein